MPARLISWRSKALKLHEYLLVQQTVANIGLSAEIALKWSLYFKVGWQTGMRPSEVLSIEAPNIVQETDENNKVVYYIYFNRLKKKNAPLDAFPIQPALYRELRAYIKERGIRGVLFPETIQGVKYIFDKVKAKSRLRDELTPHSFRHGFACYFLDNKPKDMDPLTALRILQRLLGHSSIAITSRYIQLDKEEGDKLVRKIDFTKLLKRR